MAKKGKSSSHKKDIKTMLVILFLFALVAVVFLFFHKEKTPPTISSAVAPVKVHKKSMVKKIPPGSAGKIAFILDDWGYHMGNCHYLKEIKAPLAVSVLPNLRHSDDIMKCASVNNKDIMLHLPLEPYHNLDSYPDNYVLTTAMPVHKIEKLLEETLTKMPLIVGVNNHMGSKATEDRALMKVIFQKLKNKGLFFVDSMTAPHHSICGQLADEMQLPFVKRDVFLDNTNTKEAIEKQIRELAQKARRRGYAIAIGHDRSLTLQVIKEDIPILQTQGFEIVHVKDLLRHR
ncbi:MAG: divergent polysaccharide deacetylase family protein [Candidatus Omnitrophica bacterium]|nr:divergent polysaccharide deacetylase family protein [Candidatus Omnitrophota bacterium]